MNYGQQSAVKNSRAEKRARQRRDNAVVARYMLFYCALIVIMSMVSCVCDLAFSKIDYGTIDGYTYTPFQYFPYYMLIGFLIFPSAILYNYLINNILPKGILPRIFFGIAFALLLGFFLESHYQFGYYIGKYRALKNAIALGLSGCLVEILRQAMVKYRQQQSFLKNNPGNSQKTF